jgi:hypothetical protein
VTVQSAVVQQVAFAMQLLEALQTFCPDGQPQLPPMPLHDCPVTVQSLVVQQLAVGMQLFPAAQTRKFA